MWDWPTDVFHSVWALEFSPTNIVLKDTATQPSPLRPEDAQDISRLLALPLELRMIVYEYVLISQKPLYSQEIEVGDRRMMPSDRYSLPPEIDSTILRPCKSIFREAHPVLYRGNTFVFSDPCRIRKFRDANLPCLGKSILGKFSKDRMYLDMPSVFYATTLCYMIHRFSSWHQWSPRRNEESIWQTDSHSLRYPSPHP